MVGQQQAVALSCLDHVKKIRAAPRFIKIGHLGAKTAVHLGQNRATQAVRPAPRSHQQQAAGAAIQVASKGVRARRASADRRKRRGHQRHRRDACAARRHPAAIRFSGTGNPCRPEWRYPEPGTAPCPPRAPCRTASASWPGFTGRRHPVGGKPHVRQPPDWRAGDIGHCLGNGHAAGCRGVDHRQRRAFTDGHGLTACKPRNPPA